MVADVYLFHGRAVFLFALSFLTLLLHAGVWAWFFFRSATLPLFVWVSAIAAFTYCIFCPYAYENLIWGFQWSFVACFFFASTAFICFVELVRSGRAWRAVFFSSAAAWCAESCLASGVLAWPILFCASVFVPLRRLQRAVLLGLGAIALFTFRLGYGPSIASLQPSLKQPGRLFNYLLFYFDHWLSNFLIFPGLPAAVLIMSGIAATVFLVRRRETHWLGMGLALTQAFLLGTGLLTALGRLPLGIEQSTASRYQTPVMLFWGSLFVAVLVAAWHLRSWRDLVTLNSLGLLIVLGQIPFVQGTMKWLPDRTSEISSAGEALDQGATLDGVPSWIPAAMLGGVSMVGPAVAYLHTRGVSFAPSFIAQFPQTVNPADIDPKACQGVFDSATSVGDHEVRAAGWDLTAKRRPAPRIEIVDEHNRVLATNMLHFSRPDVLQAVPGSKGLAGWRLYVPVPDNVKALRAFAVLDGKTCPIGIPRSVK